MNWWLLAYIPFTLWLHILIHEGAHALVAWRCGWRILEFRPWPKREPGIFLWGYVRYSRDVYAPAAEAWVLIAPVLAEIDWLCLCAGAAAVAYWHQAPSWVWGIIGIEAGAALVDAGRWWLGYFTNRPQSDGLKWKKIRASAGE